MPTNAKKANFPSATNDTLGSEVAFKDDAAADATNADQQGLSEERVEYHEDGSATLHSGVTRKVSAKHFTNLVEDETLYPRIAAFCTELKYAIDVDIETQRKAVEKYAEALGATGQTGKAPGGAAFSGASTVTHPIMGEVAADYTARICREMLPPAGPAKPHTEGTATKEKFDRARRVARFVNFQLRKKTRNFRAEMEQAFAQQPFAGASYIKPWREGRQIKLAFVPYDKVHRPSNADDFYSCERITHEMELSQRRLQNAMRAGIYVEHDFGLGTDPDTNKAQETSEKVTGLQPDPENIDKSRVIYETSCYWDGEGEMRPYIVTFDRDTMIPLAMYRNWEKGDETCERIDFLIEFGFWPFREGKPIGLAHMVSGLPRAATGALRALMDAALANNFPGANKIKGGQSGSSTMPAPGSIQEIENATQIDDIRKLIMPVEYNPPSPTLFQLLGFIVDAARGVVRTTFDDIIGKGRQDIPVGTMMMLVDEGTVVYSSIFARQHAAMERLLAGIYRLCYEIVGDDVQFADREGSDRVTRNDFAGDSLVVPVSDPRINSVTQRWTRANFLATRAADPVAARYYNGYEVEKRLLEAAEIEGLDAIMVKPPTPIEMAATNENVAAALGRPVTAFPEQDHLAHLESHADFVKSPVFGAHSAFMPTLIPAMLQHFKEHMVMHYAKKTMDVVDAAIEQYTGVADIREFKELFNAADTDEEKLSVVDVMRVKDPELGREVDRLFAVASASVMTSLQADFTNILPMLQSMQQVAEKFKPPMPMDPTQATMQTAALAAQVQKGIAETREQGQLARQQADLAHRSTEAEKDRLMKGGIAAQQDATRLTEIETRHQMNIEDNVTATTITNAELAAGEKSNVSTGTGINPGGR